MTDIDWSKAPEGATHYFVGAASGEWRDLSGKTWEYWHKGAWFNSGLSSSHLLTYPGDMIAVQRPPLEWNGEGLPPVGAVCECMCTAKGKERDWFVARVNYMSEHTAVLDSLVDCAEIGEFVAHPGTMKFRPLRTPEKIADEAREKAIAEMVEAIGHFGNIPAVSLFVICGILHDTGYQKATE